MGLLDNLKRYIRGEDYDSDEYEDFNDPEESSSTTMRWTSARADSSERESSRASERASERASGRGASSYDASSARARDNVTSIRSNRVVNINTITQLSVVLIKPEKFENAYVERKDMEYLYNDGDLYYFMDGETYEQVPISKNILSDNFKFVKENMICKIVSYKGNVFSVEPPLFVELEVTETEPGVKGDTATNVTKPATLETGAAIKVPLFINEGDVIKIDTRTSEYLQRVQG